MGRFRAPAWNAAPQLLLDAIALCIGDIQGLFAVLFVYCTEPVDEGGLGMHVSTAGTVMLVQGLLSTLLGPPIGRLHDRTSRKKLLFGILPVSVLVVTWMTINVTRFLPAVIIALCLQGIAGGAVPPGICALSFGVVGSAEFPARASRNEMWKHVGAVVTAGLLPIIMVDVSAGGWTAYFAVMVCVNIMAGVFLAPLRGSDVVDHAHGPPVMAPGAEVVGATRSTVPLRELLCRREMVLFMAGITMFHLANAAMLPQLGYKMDQLYTYAKMNNETTTMNMMGIDFELSGKNSIGLVTIVSQVVMVPVAKASGVFSSIRAVGSKKLLMFACCVLFVRGMWIAACNDPEVLVWTALLDGVAAGIFGVCAILLMSDLTEGTGQFAAMQGMVATCLGLGSATSHGIAGLISETLGVNVTMYFLAILTLIPLILLIGVTDRRTSAGVYVRVIHDDEMREKLINPKSKGVVAYNTTFTGVSTV